MPVATHTLLRSQQLLTTGGASLLSPESPNTVTPTGSALVILTAQWCEASGATTPTPVQPSWANQAWTEIDVTPVVGTSNMQVGAWWTLAVASPSAAAVTINFSGSGFNGTGAGCTLTEYASGFDTSTPIRQTKVASVTELLDGATLNGTFDSTPNSGSELMQVGMATTGTFQFFTVPVSGWTKSTPTDDSSPVGDEGASQTSLLAWADGANGTGFGARFGETTAHDQPTGAVILAFEIQEPVSAQAARSMHQHRLRRT